MVNSFLFRLSIQPPADFLTNILPLQVTNFFKYKLRAEYFSVTDNILTIYLETDIICFEKVLSARVISLIVCLPSIVWISICSTHDTKIHTYYFMFFSNIIRTQETWLLHLPRPSYSTRVKSYLNPKTYMEEVNAIFSKYIIKEKIFESILLFGNENRSTQKRYEKPILG